MQAFFETLLYILLFIVFLSALIMVHEAGHLCAAKAFKVYCFEYSIGFGPKLIHKKRKNGETYFSLRAVPFGGFVSMYGEADVVPDGVETPPPERSLANIKRWKRIIVLVAGVFMNAVLALLIFFITNCCMEQTGIWGNQYTLTKDTFMYQSFSSAGLVEETTARDGTQTYLGTISYLGDDEFYKEYPTLKDYKVLSLDGVVTYTSESGKLPETFIVILSTQISDLNFENNLSYIPFTLDGNGKMIFDVKTKITPNKDIADMEYNFTRVKKDETKVQVNVPLGAPVIDESTGTSVLVFRPMKMTFAPRYYWNDFGTGLANTFGDFGNSSTAIVRGFISLFTSAEARQSTSGIIGIGVVSTQVLKTNGWTTYLYLWGLISVNLAIINLLPFPGLDGWHILVNIIEGVTRKEIPPKVKGIVSAVGLICLFALMAVLVVSDIFKYLV